ncbi:phycobiliprotein lyase [Leptolyngbya cf. ectocarpi LEGE 11479]|uniref:Chromophore lyase CpcS/CpeS n=1 Tax=Leptolyngbya cf. ectocarpi LEGE 11479 TaxID=1828722 RepID=A0A928ZTE2_LEPEC|nr:phycobiliprotein lyase [Leptolyngbya ectocarpi]MBE9065189.1 phycobiliprotein lyase [Leptolyngbya cf. ectocarpi LEGE 11479]
MNFFKKQGGRWFSQRTTHYLKAGDSKAGKSDLEITDVDINAAEVTQLCDQANCDATHVVGALRIAQKSTIIAGPSREQMTLLVAIAADETSGQLLRQTDGQTQASQYRFEKDVLTITTEANGIQSEERWWLITDNLRMRTNVLTSEVGQIMASFCSEIRLGDVKS